MNRLLAVLTLVIASLSAQNSAVTPAQLVGTWRLVSITETLPDGTSRPDRRLGPNARGYLMYEPDGHICANIMNPDRPAWKDPSSGTEREKAESFDGMGAYCGTYKLDQAHQRVIHYPEVAWTPQYVGTIQYRPFRIEGNRLIITDGSKRRVLVWERAPAR